MLPSDSAQAHLQEDNLELVRLHELGIPCHTNWASVGIDIVEVIRRTVRAEFLRRHRNSLEDIEDVCSDAIVALLAQEGEDSLGVPAESIQNVEAWVVAIALRACSAWSRRRYPTFHRLRTRLRYLLNSDSGFAIWQEAGRAWVCGFAEWKEERPAIRAEPEGFRDLLARDRLVETMKAIFARARCPLYFNDLARIVAQICSINDTPDTLETPDLAATREEMEGVLDRTTLLGKLWREISELPPRQRTSLLLNMRAEGGECATSLLVLTGTTSMEDLASAIGISAEEITGLWHRLPLSDLEIAERMQLTRQQVINLRKCARERLRRRVNHR